jgi:hypothetical protein
MTRYAFQRGCLVGNLGQEVVQLSPELRLRLEQILLDWEALLARCLRDAVTAGELPLNVTALPSPISSGSAGKGPYCAHAWWAIPSPCSLFSAFS